MSHEELVELNRRQTIVGVGGQHRLDAFYALKRGEPVSKVAQAHGVDRKTVRQWCRRVRDYLRAVNADARFRLSA